MCTLMFLVCRPFDNACVRSFCRDVLRREEGTDGDRGGEGHSSERPMGNDPLEVVGCIRGWALL